MMWRTALLLVWVGCCSSLVNANTPTESSGHHRVTHSPNAVNRSDFGVGHDVSDSAWDAKNPGLFPQQGRSAEEGEERYPVAVIDFERVQTPFIIGLWIFCACLGKIGFHMTPKLSHVFPESCMLIVLGVIIGLLLFYTNAASVSPLTADTFFLYLLPPIILDAGYFMPNRLFFDHLFTILVFAVIGTIWNAMSIGITMYAINLTGLFGTDIPVLSMFLFSSLISAVDPVAVLAVFEEIHVEEVLYILVFGESLLNDGVTVVLYHLFEGFSELGEDNLKPIDIASGVLSFLLVALGGTAIGIIWGFLTAFVTRFTSQVRVIEPIFVFVMSYLAYLNAEIFHLSGILSITFCGITMKNYVEQNISSKSHTTIKYAMKMLASSAETVIFMFLGVSTVQSTHDWNTWFVLLTILFCSVYRILGVIMFSSMVNRFRVKKIQFVEKFVMCYGGLRGAVAFALVITIDPHHIVHQPMFLTATIAMVYFTVFVQGITIKPLVQILGVKKAEKRTLTMNERLHERTMDYLIAGIEDVMGKHGNLRIRNKYKRFNNKYLTPLLVRENNVIEPKFLETYTQIQMQEAMAYVSNNTNSPNNIESFTKLLRDAAAHPHLLKNNHGEWNLDVGELEYNPTARDISDAKFHHLLSSDYKPIKRQRGSTYKRHAVKDDDVQTQTDINHRNMYLHTRQYVSSIRRVNRKPKKMAENKLVKALREEDTRAAYQYNGSSIKLKSDYIARVLRDNPAFENDEGIAAYLQQDNAPITTKRQSIRGPTMAETALPWKRYYEEEVPSSAMKLQRSMSVGADDGDNSSPTAAEVTLPWKRPEDQELCSFPLRQGEFPAWASNKDYISYHSPSSTFLGALGNKHESYPNIREIFSRRSSSSSLGSRRSSLKDHPHALKDRSNSRSSMGEPHPPHPHQLKERSASHSSIGDRTTAEPQIRQRSSTGDGSLLNTIILEEDGKRDTIITMSPDAGDTEHTKM